MKLTVDSLVEYLLASGAGAYNARLVRGAFGQLVPDATDAVGLLLDVDLPQPTIDRIVDAIENGIPVDDTADAEATGKKSKELAALKRRLDGHSKTIEAQGASILALDEVVAGQAGTIASMSDQINELKAAIPPALPAE